MRSRADVAGTNAKKGRATRRAKDGDRAAVQDHGNDGHQNALENRLNCKIGKRNMREVGAMQREVDRQIDYQRSGGDECSRVERIEFRLPHRHGEACPQERRGQEQRMADVA